MVHFHDVCSCGIYVDKPTNQNMKFSETTYISTCERNRFDAKSVPFREGELNFDELKVN